MKQQQLSVIGLMSGSSLDGLDIAHVIFDVTTSNNAITINSWDLLAAETLPFSEKWQARLAHLPQQSALNYAKTHTYFGRYMGELVQSFLNKHHIQVDFIASHGHTIFHHPEKMMTAQIGDGAALAAVTGYPVICDFRTTDVALGGEGAPIAPIVDNYLFGEYDFLLNIGGIANISCKTTNGYVAFDIGAANQLFNVLAHTVGLDYDEGGRLGSEGSINDALLEHINTYPFFERPYPKSLSNAWVQQIIIPPYLEAELSISDKLRTAYEQLAIQLQSTVSQLIKKEQLTASSFKLLATGGGTFNTFLIEIMQAKLTPLNVEIVIPDADIIAFKEAILMGLMGVFRFLEVPNCFQSVTGADRDNIGGAIYI